MTSEDSTTDHDVADVMNRGLLNPLSSEERSLAADVLKNVAASFADTPYDPDIDLPEDVQRERVAAFVADCEAAGAAIVTDVVTFSQAAHTRQWLETIADAVEAAPSEVRMMKEAAAKLEVLCAAELPARLEAFAAAQRKHAQERGFAIQHVGGQDEPLPQPPFSYTVGLTLHDHPELAVVAMPMDAADWILTELCTRVLAGERFSDGEINTTILPNGLPMRFEHASDELNGELRLVPVEVGERPRALQVLMPDPNGRLPGDPDVDADYAAKQRFSA